MRLCEFEGCNRKHRVRGLCAGHEAQLKRGKKLTPLREVISKAERLATPEGHKICSRCKETKPLDNFHRGSKQDYAGVHSYCKACCQSLLLNEYKDRRFNSVLRHRFKISKDQYDSLLESQNGGCAICGKTAKENGKALAVDHDHSCCPGYKTCGKCIRQLLCTRCNTVLGLMDDDPALLQKAILYLSNHTSEKT